MQFTVGLKKCGRSEHLTVTASDALIAALKVKLEQPNATITYVRRKNRRGDARHPAVHVRDAASDESEPALSDHGNVPPEP